jgi:hypothetical protein
MVFFDDGDYGAPMLEVSDFLKNGDDDKVSAIVPNAGLAIIAGNGTVIIWATAPVIKKVPSFNCR